MNTKDKVSRRNFIRQFAVGIAATSLAFPYACSKEKEQIIQEIPKRVLGKTGLEVTTLTFGGGSQFLKNDDGDWEPMLEKAIEMGINLYDTASTYQWQASKSSEERFGQILPAYRNKIILSTKFESREVDKALTEIETSLKLLKTDYLDLLMIHSIEPSEDIAALEKGVYKEMVRLKEQGVTRFIGFSSMNSAEKSKEAIEKLDLDVVILALNPTQYGDFARIALPAAIEKNIGVLAMKVMRNLVGKEASAKELMGYALSQPGVATVLIGHYGMKTLLENAHLATELTTAMTISECRKLAQRLAHLAGPHALCWARPDYRDGVMV